MALGGSPLGSLPLSIANGGTGSNTAAAARTALGLGTIATQAASAVAVTGGTVAGLTGLAIRDTSAAFDVTIAATSSAALTAGRTLTIDVKNAARTIALGGNVALGGTLTTGAALTVSGAFAATLTVTAETNVTLPTTGTLATLAGSEALTGKTYNGLTITTTTGTLTLGAGSSLITAGAFAATLTVTAETNVTLPTTGTLATLAGSEELTNKTLNGSVGKGTWTASGTWTLPAITVGGVLSCSTKLDVTGVNSDTIFDGQYSSAHTIGADGGSWGFRSGTAHDFNLDVYNGGSPITALKITQAGATTISKTLVVGTTGADLLGFYGHAAAAQQTKAGHNNWAAISDVTAALAAIGLIDAA